VILVDAAGCFYPFFRFLYREHDVSAIVCKNPMSLGIRRKVCPFAFARQFRRLSNRGGNIYQSLLSCVILKNCPPGRKRQEPAFRRRLGVGDVERRYEHDPPMRVGAIALIQVQVLFSWHWDMPFDVGFARERASSYKV
jgi:hypothetical protein